MQWVEDELKDWVWVASKPKTYYSRRWGVRRLERAMMAALAVTREDLAVAVREGVIETVDTVVFSKLLPCGVTTCKFTGRRLFNTRRNLA